MSVPMMLIVNMGVRMLHRLMLMFMFVIFGQM
jgi:hypothetical protein